MQAIWRALMRPAGAGQAFQKAGLLQRPERASHATLGQAQRLDGGKRSPVERERQARVFVAATGKCRPQPIPHRGGQPILHDNPLGLLARREGDHRITDKAPPPPETKGLTFGGLSARIGPATDIRAGFAGDA